MPDGVIQVPLDDVGKRVATWITPDGDHQEVIVLGGSGNGEHAFVLAADPAAGAFALPVRQAPPIDPKFERQTSIALAVGATATLDFATIPVATTGELMAVLVSSTALMKFEVQTRDGAVIISVATLFSSAAEPSFEWQPKHKKTVTLAGAGVDENFRVVVTNLDNQPADAYVTAEWDET